MFLLLRSSGTWSLWSWWSLWSLWSWSWSWSLFGCPGLPILFIICTLFSRHYRKNPRRKIGRPWPRSTSSSAPAGTSRHSRRPPRSHHERPSSTTWACARARPSGPGGGGPPRSVHGAAPPPVRGPRRRRSCVLHPVRAHPVAAPEPRSRRVRQSLVVAIDGAGSLRIRKELAGVLRRGAQGPRPRAAFGVASVHPRSSA